MTGYFSFFDQTGIERSQNDVLSGDDDLLFVNKLVDLLSNKSGKGGNVQLTLDREAQDAAFEALTNLQDSTGDPSRPRSWRSSRAPARSWRWPRCRRFDPNKLASHDFTAVKADYDRLQADPSEPLLNRAIQTTLPPGSTFKLVTAAAAIESGKYDADSEVPGGPTYQLPQTTGSSGLIDNEGRDCGTDKIPFEQAMENSCNTTFAQLGVELGAEAMQEQAEAFGFNEHYLDDIGPQSISNFPDDANPAADRPVRDRPVRGAGHPAADGDGGGRDRQPGRGDEALPRRLDPVARARDAQADRARGAHRGGLAPRPPTRSPS